MISTSIAQKLNIDVSVLMGANVALDIALQKPSESTLGYTNLPNAQKFKNILQTSYFRINLINDTQGPELLGALKNVVAVAFGLIDALGSSENTKAAIIRIGLAEMRLFCHYFAPKVHHETFFESCGIADLIAR
jgi:glycerol-3-phosphate dehydrogenase (NAD+)